MPPTRFPFGRLTALAALGAAGLADRLSAWPADPVPSGWGAAALLGLAGAAWVLRRRPAAPLPLLNLTLRVAEPQTMEGVLRFVSAAPLAWCARRGEWCLELEAGAAVGGPWRLELRHARHRRPAMTLASAATFDDALTASRRRYAAHPALREAASLLACDLEFLLPASRQRITALAGGGYALRDAAGSHALSPSTVDVLLGEAGRLHGAA